MISMAGIENRKREYATPWEALRASRNTLEFVDDFFG